MDTRRKEREMKRNKRMTAVLSGISVIFAISWLPYHAYLILTDIFILGVSIQIFKRVTYVCHLCLSLMFATYVCNLCLLLSYVCHCLMFVTYICNLCLLLIFVTYVGHLCLTHNFPTLIVFVIFVCLCILIVCLLLLF